MDCRYEKVKELGEGKFGKVYRVKDTDYALKLIYVTNQNEIDNVKREVEIHKKLSHNNIVKYIDAGLISSSNNTVIKLKHMFPYHAIAILMELCDTTLAQELTIRSNVEVSIAKKVFTQILNGVDYLHSNNIIHRDLKPQNILIKWLKNNDFCTKISDFGFGKEIQNGLTVHSETKGTPGYSPPEQLKGHICTTAGDIFSLGIILMELYTMQAIKLWFQDFWSNLSKPKIPHDVPQKIEKLVRHMTHLDPANRPTAKDVSRYFLTNLSM